MNNTTIEWTDFSANPIKFRDASGRVVWGCVHASPGCQHCYAETLATRYGKGGPFNVPTMAGLTPFLDEAELHKMLTSKRISGRDVSGSRCFVGDMTDIFGPWVPDEMLDKLFAVFALRPDVMWQVLTKRAERMRQYMTTGSSTQGMQGRWGALIDASFDLERDGVIGSFMRDGSGKWWPLRNVHLGVSCEDQALANERIPHLLQTPAAVRFVSAEPLLGPIRFAAVPGFNRAGSAGVELLRNVWVIVGGESGPQARPCYVAWVRSLVEQCRSAGVPAFVKQLGSNVRDLNDAGWDGIEPTEWPADIAANDCIEHDPDGSRDGYQGAPVRVRLVSRKGGDPSEWPEDLRVREFPSGGGSRV